MPDLICRKCGFPLSSHRASRLAHHSECTLDEFEPLEAMPDVPTPDQIAELERLEKAATPGSIKDFGDGALTTVGPWGCQTLLCYQKIPMPDCEAQFRNPADRELLMTLRNSARQLIKAAKKNARLKDLVNRYLNYHNGVAQSDSAYQVEECLCSVCCDARDALEAKHAE